jgi:hypothetical protein
MLGCCGYGQIALVQDLKHLGNLAAYEANPRRILKAGRRYLKAKIEHLLAQILEPFLQLVVRHFA